MWDEKRVPSLQEQSFEKMRISKCIIDVHTELQYSISWIFYDRKLHFCSGNKMFAWLSKTIKWPGKLLSVFIIYVSWVS